MRPSIYLFIIYLFLAAGYVQADFESDVIDLVNQERETRGLHPLSYDHYLAVAARGHSDDMGIQDYFSHTSLDGRTVPDRISAAGYHIIPMVKTSPAVSRLPKMSSMPGCQVPGTGQIY